MDIFLLFSSIFLVTPHGQNLLDHAILTIPDMSGFTAWKPSYRDAEVAGFFVYIFFGIVHCRQGIGTRRPITYTSPRGRKWQRSLGRYWSGLGETNSVAGYVTRCFPW